MEANAVSQIFEYGVTWLAYHSPAREKVPDATSEVNRQRHDQVTSPRSKAQQESEQRDDYRGCGAHGQILGAAEAMAYGGCVQSWHRAADEYDAKGWARTERKHHETVDPFVHHKQKRG